MHLTQTTITPPFHQTYGGVVCGFALEFGMLEQAQKAWLLDTAFLRYDIEADAMSLCLRFSVEKGEVIPYLTRNPEVMCGRNH